MDAVRLRYVYWHIAKCIIGEANLDKLIFAYKITHPVAIRFTTCGVLVKTCKMHCKNYSWTLQKKNIFKKCHVK